MQPDWSTSLSRGIIKLVDLLILCLHFFQVVLTILME